jgi:DNA mismatch repair ATPase MutS
MEKDSQIEKDIRNLDIDSLTPIEALNLISQFKNKI